MFSNRYSIALDIGSRYTKVVCGRKENNRVSIAYYDICDTPFDLNCDPNGSFHIAGSISNIIKMSGLKLSNVLIGLNNQDIIMRHVEMPPLRKKYLQQAAEYEFREYLASNSDEYVISGKIIGVNERGSNTDVLVVAVPKRTVNCYLNAASMIGLPVIMIDVFADSLAELFNSGMNKKHSVLLIDIGYNHTELVLVEDGKLYFHRALSIGCINITNLNNDLTGFDDEAPLEDLVFNISRVIDFYTSSRPGKIINSLYLHGGGSSIKGIKDYIGSLIDIDIKLFDSTWYNMRGKIKLMDDTGIYVNCISLINKV